MTRDSTASTTRLYWRACTRWVLVGLFVIGLIALAGLHGPGGRWAGLGRALSGLPDQVALLLALAGFAGGFAVGQARPLRRGSMAAAFITAALATYLLAALVNPLTVYWLTPDAVTRSPAMRPLGPELPWTLWHLRTFVVQEGLAGGGPITPGVRSHLYGFAFYYPFVLAAVGASMAWAGLVVGRRFVSLGRPVVSGSVAWLVWIGQAAGFYAATRIAITLILYAHWSAELVAFLPLAVPIVVAGVLALVHASGGEVASPGRRGR